MIVAVSQDHVKEIARKTWMDYIDVRNRMDSLDKLVKDISTKTKKLEKNEEKDVAQIDEMNEKLDAVNKKLRKSQAEYLKISNNVKIAYDSIKLLNTGNNELTILADSFSVALLRERSVKEQLQIEKDLLEKSLYYKIADLEIAEVEGSYFSKFAFGYEKKGKEIIYSVNSKDQSKKPLFKSLDYLRFTGNVYVPPGIDSLEGRILIYKDDKLLDEVRQRFIPEQKTKSYNYFEINGNNVKLNKSVPTKGDLKMAFVTDEVYHINRDKLQNFYESYKSALFVITSIKPFVSVSADDDKPVLRASDNVEVFAQIDSLKTNSGRLRILVCNNSDFSGEYVSLVINDSVINKEFKLVTFNHSVAYNYKFEKGANMIKIKVLSVSSVPNMPNCYLWLYISTIENEKIIYKKRVVLKKDDVFAVYMQNL